MGNYQSLCTFLREAPSDFTIFLGAGASITSGGKSYKEIVFGTLEKHNELSRDVEQDDTLAFEKFYKLLRSVDEETRYQTLREYFEDMFPSIGYAFLAKIIQKAFKDGNLCTIITTNYDFMLEISLSQAADLLPGKHYAPYIAGLNDEVIEKVHSDPDRLKIIKLHGDFHAKSLKTLNEELQLTDSMKTLLKRALGRRVLFIGYSGQDRDVIDCIPGKGGPIFWVSPKRPCSEEELVHASPENYYLNTEVDMLLKSRNSKYHKDRCFTGSDGYFDDFVKNFYRVYFPEKNVDEEERFFFRKFAVYKNKVNQLDQWVQDYSRKAIKNLLKSKDRSMPISELLGKLDIDRMKFDELVLSFHKAQLDYDVKIEGEKIILMPKKLNVEEKRKLNIQSKYAIAKKALEYVKDGYTILLDAGTTTLEISRLIKDRIGKGQLRNISVVTNSIDIVNELAQIDSDDLEVISVNGRVVPRTLAIVGEDEVGIKKIVKQKYDKDQADISFVGATGIHLEWGFSNNHPIEKTTKAGMLRAGRQKFIVADHSKFGKRWENQFAPLSEDIKIITDALDLEIFERYISHVEIIEAD